MTTYSKSDIELFDKTFKFFLDYHCLSNTNYQPTDSYISKQLSVSKDNAQYAINEVCRLGHDMGILTAQQFPFGTLDVVRMDKIKCLNFQSQGGFKNLYESKVEIQLKEAERQRLNDEKLKAEVDIVKFQRGLGKKFTIWAFVVSVIAVISSVLTTLVTSNNDKDMSPKVDTAFLNDRLQKLDLHIQKLEQQIRKDTIPKR
jgi:hypothetical protein